MSVPSAMGSSVLVRRSLRMLALGNVLLAEGAMIQLGETRGWPLQFFEGKELAMPQRRDDPTLGDLHRILKD